MSAKRLPPLARRHARQARAGFQPAKGVIVLDGWALYRKSKRFAFPGAWLAVRPDETPAAELDWSWTAGFPVLVVARPDADRIEALGAALTAAGCADVSVLMPHEPGPILMDWRAISHLSG